MKILFLTNNHITTPLYKWLVNHGENVLYSEDHVTAEDVAEKEIDFVVSYNYIYIIPPDIISLMQDRIINLHISYLPWNRGASPNIFSFLEGTPSGISIHQVTPKLDCGGILVQERLHFDYEIETLKSSYEKSHKAIQEMFQENWEQIKRCELQARPQCGKGSYHRSSELAPYKDILDYNDSIETFLKKAMRLNHAVHFILS